MAWIDPRTWLAGEVVTALLLNTELRDQLLALKDPPFDIYAVDEASDYTTSSSTFVAVDATDLTLSITNTVESDLEIGFFGLVTNNTNTTRVSFDVAIDGVAVGGDAGLQAVEIPTGGITIPVCFVAWKQAVAAGTHTVQLQWRTITGTSATLYAGAGTGTLRDVHPQFWVREAS